MNNALPNPFVNQTVQITTTFQNTNVTSNIRKGPRAGTNGVLVQVILDESGSMGSCLNDTILGFNEFLKGQRETNPKAKISLTKFEGGRISKLYENMPVAEAPELSTKNYRPAGGTNLFDAVVSTIYDNVDDILYKSNEEDRPAVIVVIITDGEENQSKIYRSAADVKSIITDREEKEWTFTFIGANVDAFDAGGSIGVTANASLQFDAQNVGATFAAASASVTRMSKSKMAGVSTETLRNDSYYTTEERASTVKGK